MDEIYFWIFSFTNYYIPYYLKIRTNFLIYYENKRNLQFKIRNPRNQVIRVCIKIYVTKLWFLDIFSIKIIPKGPLFERRKTIKDMNLCFTTKSPFTTIPTRQKQVEATHMTICISSTSVKVISCRTFL